MPGPMHPMFVHFPIALILSALALDALGMVFENEKLRDAAYRVLWLAVLGAVATVATGFYAHSQLPAIPEQVHDLVELHEHAALITLGTAATALLIRIVAEHTESYRNLARGISFFLLLASAATVGATGYLGGKMVFDHGLGTKFYTPAAPSQSGPQNGEEIDNGNSSDENRNGGDQGDEGRNIPHEWH